MRKTKGVALRDDVAILLTQSATNNWFTQSVYVSYIDPEEKLLRLHKAQRCATGAHRNGV